MSISENLTSSLQQEMEKEDDALQTLVQLFSNKKGKWQEIEWSKSKDKAANLKKQ